MCNEVINPLITGYAFWCCLTLSACYQLVQSVLKIGFALAKKVGWVDLFKTAVHMAAALAGCRRALVSTGWTIHTLLAQMGVEATPLPLQRHHFWDYKQVLISKEERLSVGEP